MSSERGDAFERMFAPKSDPHLEESRLTATTVYQGDFLRVERDDVRMPDGVTAYREYIVHPGAVMIVPVLDNGHVVLERQYRYPHHRAFVEFPAGKIDPHEAPIACARRELAEETGYSAREWFALGTIHNAIAYSNERIEIFLARGLTSGSSKLDVGEFLDVFDAPLTDVARAIEVGYITDVKTIVGAQWAQAFLAGRWSARDYPK